MTDDGGAVKVLVVDDDPFVRDLIASILQVADILKDSELG